MNDEHRIPAGEGLEPLSLEDDGIVKNPPSLPGEVVAFQDPDEVLSRLARDIVDHALQCVRKFGDFHIALSGGHTPFPLYTRLMTDPAYRALPWGKTHLWIVDERRVPFDDDRSNFKHIKAIIGDHSGIPPQQIHPMEVMEEHADDLYQKALEDTLGWREKGHDRLDFVLLGMGSDGHTASLFPNSRALDVEDRLVTTNSGPTVVPPDRVTMTYRLLNASRLIAALVMGDGKAEMLHRIATGDDTSHELPIKGIKPLGGVFRWYLDGAACGETPDDASAQD